MEQFTTFSGIYVSREHRNTSLLTTNVERNEGLVLRLQNKGKKYLGAAPSEHIPHPL